MFKKFVSGFMALVMLFSLVSVLFPAETIYAFDNFNVEVIKSKAPIREGYYESKDVKKWVTKGTVLTVTGEKRNLWGNLWYKVKGGGYIFNENVKKTHNHKVVFSHYETKHPHYAVYKCKSCDNGGYCGSETKKQNGCEKCYPSSTESKKNDTNKVPNSNTKTNSDLLTPNRPSLQEEAEKNLGAPVCNHNYRFSHYNALHPHYAVYKCSCGDNYTDNNKYEKRSDCSTCYPPHKHEYKLVNYSTSHPHNANYKCSCGSAYSGTETKKQDGCEKCYPHEHSYELVGYENAHPHSANYKCWCGSAYCGAETTKVKECTECYPYGYGNDHFCQFYCTTRFLNEHPHYNITQCSICKKEGIDYDNTNYSSKCDICNTSFKENVQNVPDFHGRVYDLSTGGIIYTPKQVTIDELYDFAETLHLTLDTLGLVPGYGEIFDGVNVLYYIVEGNYVDAALSGAAMVPFVGTVSTSGKIARKTGKLVRNTAKETFSIASEKVAKEVASKQIKSNISDFAGSILKNAKFYPESTLKSIKKISENSSITFKEAFYQSQPLVEASYRGTVTSTYKLKYGYVKDSNSNSIVHIIDRHAIKNIRKSAAGNFFNVNDEAIFDIIEEAYTSGKKLGNPIPRKKRLAYYYDMPYVIGSDGETILCLVLEGNNVITAYPVYAKP